MRISTNSIKLKLRRLAVLCLMLSCGGSFANVYAQEATRPAQTEDKTARQTRLLLENCLRQAEEVDYLTAKVKALERLDAQGKELVAALDAQIAAQEKTIAALKAANAAGDKIETISDKELKSYQKSLDDAKAQIAKWQARAGFWKHVSLIATPLLIVVAVAATLVAGK